LVGYVTGLTHKEGKEEVAEYYCLHPAA
jgi:hypothetical protein